jgi:RNA polymerase sigma factor (sigma-70 family)
MPMTEDAELLRRYVAGKSEEAFAELVRRHLDLVYSTALRRLAGDTHLAQDVAQSVFAALARKAPLLTGRATLAGWLYLGAHHAAAQAVRGEQRRRNREQEAHIMHDQLSSSVPTTDWDRVRPVLDAALRELNDADREAVLLRYFERRPFADIGAALQLGEDAARMRVDRALEKLRALLARRGVTSTAAALGAALANQAMIAAPAGLATAIAGMAFTGSAATAATAAGFFMNTTTLVTGAVTVLALGAAVFQTNQNHRLEAELAILGRDRDGLRAQLRDTQQRAIVAEQRGASLQRDLEAVRVQKTTAMTAAPAAQPERNSSGQILTTDSSGIKGILSLRPSPAPGNPAESRRLIRLANLESAYESYRSLFHQLGFTPAQREQFKALLSDHLDRRDEQMKAAMTAARAQNPAPDRAALQTVLDTVANQSYAEWQTTMRGAFGETMLQTFQHYADTGAGREVTRELSGALFYTETPLTVEQADQLVEIIAANSRNAHGKVDLTVMNDEAILAQAGAVLSEPQLAALRRAQAAVRQKWTPVEPDVPAGSR